MVVHAVQVGRVSLQFNVVVVKLVGDWRRACNGTYEEQLLSLIEPRRDGMDEQTWLLQRHYERRCRER